MQVAYRRTRSYAGCICRESTLENGLNIDSVATFMNIHNLWTARQCHCEHGHSGRWYAVLLQLRRPYKITNDVSAWSGLTMDIAASWRLQPTRERSAEQGLREVKWSLSHLARTVMQISGRFHNLHHVQAEPCSWYQDGADLYCVGHRGLHSTKKYNHRPNGPIWSYDRRQS